MTRRDEKGLHTVRSMTSDDSLPRIDDLPAGDGFDRRAVEEALSAYQSRVRELETAVRVLRSPRTAPAPSSPAPMPGYLEDDESWPGLDADVGPAPDWVSTVPPPLPRPLVVPRLVLEGAFLALVAVGAALADLGAAGIVLLMGAAWALVAGSEWIAAARRARWRLEQVSLIPVAPATLSEETDPWAVPPVELTAMAPPDGSESRTMVAKLPPAAVGDETEVHSVPALPEPAASRDD